MKKNIVMICDYFDKDMGYQENVLMDSFISKGHSCSIVCAPQMDIFDYYAGKSRYLYSSKDEESIHRLDYLFRFGPLKLLRNLRRKIEELQPDILFVHDINFSLLIAAIYVKKNKNCILICDNHCDESNSAKNIFSKYIFYKLIKRLIVMFASSSVKKFYGVTPLSIDFMVDFFKVPIEKTELLPLCIEVPNIDFSKSKESFLRELAIEDKKFIIFTGGKLNSSKRTDILIKAIEERDDVILLICGAFEDEKYEQKVKDLTFGKEFIKFLGWQSLENIFKYMNFSDIAIFPGSQSVMWQQAICSGLPILVGIDSKNGTDQDVGYMSIFNAIDILDKKNDFNIQINNYITNLKNNPETYNQKVEAANKTAKEILSYNRYINEMESWFDII